MQALAYDPGYGNIKLFGTQGGLIMQSAVSVGTGQHIGRMAGLRRTKPPLRIETEAGVFHVGATAHDWGRPVESLDFDRLSGSPEMMALWYGALVHHGVPAHPVDLMVGLPIHVLMGDQNKATQQAVRRSLQGTHTWLADGQEHRIEVATVRLTSQPVGAMFDYLLDDDGGMSSARQTAFKSEIGILGIGMNTMELLVVRNRAPVQRLTAGESLGVRRLLELTHIHGRYSLAERDAMLRKGILNVDEARAVWQSEVLGFVERQWGELFRRFKVIIAVGGGSLLLRDVLMRRFRERLHLSDDPVLATARGLYKYMLMTTKRNG